MRGQIQTLIKSVSGYIRIYTTMVASGLLVLLVIGYQTVALGRFKPITTPSESVQFTTVQLFPQSLPSLESIYYELWITSTVGDRSLGRFRLTADKKIINANGNIVDDAYFPLPADINKQTITGSRLQLADGTNGRSITYMTGSVSKDRVAMTIPYNREAISGQYMLATPTDGNVFVNETSGLWYGDVSNNQGKLNMQPPMPGFVFESNVIVNGQTLSTGRFVDATARDAFFGYNDQPSLAPRFPGEDFLMNAPANVSFPLDLTGQTIVISLEPDFGSTMSESVGIELFRQEIPGRATARRLYNLNVSEQDLPVATVVFR